MASARLSAETHLADTFGGAGLRLTIDLGALTGNWRLMQRSSGPAECAAVVKADAYGLGARQVTSALVAASCRTFFVALPHEGAAVRQSAPDADIYVLNGFLPEAASIYRTARLQPVLGSRPELEQWATINGGPSALQVDTGMNRLGVVPAEVAGVFERGLADRAGVALVMSHLACADEPAHPLNSVQLGRFQSALASAGGRRASLANSDGVALGGDYLFDLVRPGIALYGGVSSSPVQPVVTAQARVLQIREAEAGSTIGYGASRTLDRASRIAILSVGYADGYLRSASAPDGLEGPSVAFKPGPAPVLGRVSMDLLAVDVTDLPSTDVFPGAMAELFGPNVSLQAVAAAADTIPYELLTGLSRRAARRYVGQDGAGPP